MGLDRRAKRLLDALALASPERQPALTIETRRRDFDALMQMGANIRETANVRDVLVDGWLRLRAYSTGTAPQAPVIVFFHGGGLVAGSVETHDGICQALARSSGFVVVSVGYRLAPEHKFPACLEDARLAIEWIAAHADELGFDATRIAIGGDSAGALIAALISCGYCSVNVDIGAQLLLCPVVDLASDSLSRREFSSGYLIDDTTIAHDIGHCLTGPQSAVDLPSPLRLEAARRPPPTFIVTAECDPFRDEASQYAEMLEHMGVPVELTCHAGMIHSFYSLPALLPQAGPALEAAGKALAVCVSESI